MNGILKDIFIILVGEPEEPLEGVLDSHDFPSHTHTDTLQTSLKWDKNPLK